MASPGLRAFGNHDDKANVLNGIGGVAAGQPEAQHSKASVILGGTVGGGGS
jgi:hypothetical protein